MYEFIEGNVVEKSPAHVVIKSGAIAYYLHISVHTYAAINTEGEQRLYLHHVQREDVQMLYAFISKKEREIFRLLLSVSGVGANTARLILSSMNASEVSTAILSGNVVALQSIKGIGAKSAQRIIVDLRDKIGKADESDDLFQLEGNTEKDEALSALVALGFPRKTVEKALTKVLGSGDLSVEDVVKAALKLM